MAGNPGAPPGRGLAVAAAVAAAAVLLRTSPALGSEYPPSDFVHTECFNHYGDPSGMAVTPEVTAALVQGYMFDLDYQIDASAHPLTTEDYDSGNDADAYPIPDECFQDGSLPIEDNHYMLDSCDETLPAQQMLRICLTVCSKVPGCVSAMYFKTIQGNKECRIMNDGVDWPRCAYYPFRYGCSEHQGDLDDMYLGVLCPAEPLNPLKYIARSSGSGPSATHLARWRVGGQLKLNDVHCDETHAAGAVEVSWTFGGDEFTPREVWCSPTGNFVMFFEPESEDLARIAAEALDASACGPRTPDDPGENRPDCTTSGLAATIARDLMQRLDLAEDSDDVLSLEASSWTRENWRESNVPEYPSCYDDDGNFAGRWVTPDMAVMILNTSQLNPENHRPPAPFFQSMRSPEDLYPIPDDCFADNVNDGTPSNRALSRHGNHFDMRHCTGNSTHGRSIDELMMICLTIARHMDWGSDVYSLDVDKPTGVNFDEHGHGGHCHMHSAIDYYHSPTCLGAKINKAGLCTALPGLTSRPLCQMMGWPEADTRCGQINYIGFGCQLDAFSCDSMGSGAVERVIDGELRRFCEPCAPTTYGIIRPRTWSYWGDSVSPEIVPHRPDEQYPALINFCEECPEGRLCVGGSGCTLDSDMENCPARCPVGHLCETGFDRAQPCKSNEYQDETGQSVCKKCPTLHAMREGSERVIDCICQDGEMREDISSFNTTRSNPCMKCVTGLDCEWLHSARNFSERASYNDDSIAMSRLDQILTKSVMQTMPFLLPGYWADNTSVRDVLLCSATRTHPNCIGGIIGPGICSQGRQGVACAECADGFQVIKEGGCEPCEAKSDVPLAVFLMVVVFVVIFVVHRVGNVPKAKESLDHMACVVALGLLLQFVQTASALNQMKVDWGNAFGPVLDVLSFVSFRFDVVKMQCVVSSDPVVSFLVKMLIPPGLLVVFLVMFFTDRAISEKSRERYTLDTLINTVGTIIFSFYIPLMLASLAPLICFRHPNLQESNFMFPQVFCWEGGTHADLVALAGVFAALYMVGIFSMCVTVVLAYPFMTLREDFRFVRKFRFLFVRWRPSRYFYTVAVLLRNSAIAVVPVIIAYDSPVVQINVLNAVLLFSLGVQLSLWPFRTDELNVLDGVLTIGLLLGVNFAATSIGDGSGMSEANSIAFAAIVIILLCGSFACVVGKRIAIFMYPKRYSVFLSHHKGSGGNTARLMKLLLGQCINGRIFYDSDDFVSTDLLFDAVRWSEHLVVIFSAEVLCRPWCVGEIVTAYQCQVPTMPLVLSTESGSLDKICELALNSPQEYREVYRKFDILRSFDINPEDIQAAAKDLLEKARIHVRDFYSAVQEVGKQLPQQRAGSLPQMLQRLCGSNVDEGQGAKYAVIGDDSDMEAQSVTMFCKLALVEQFQEPVYADVPCGEVAAKASMASLRPADALAKAEAVVVIVTPGMFSSASLAARLALLQRLPQRFVQPVLTAKDFQLPSDSFYDSLERTGLPLAASPGELEAKVALAAAGAGLPMDGEPISAGEVSDAFRRLFTCIAIPFEINSASQEAIDGEVASLTARISAGVALRVQRSGSKLQRASSSIACTQLIAREATPSKNTANAVGDNVITV